jgi:hypothetical protein
MSRASPSDVSSHLKLENAVSSDGFLAELVGEKPKTAEGGARRKHLRTLQDDDSPLRVFTPPTELVTRADSSQNNKSEALIKRRN